MATTHDILQVQGTQLLFADVTDFPNAGAGPPATAANSLLRGTGTKVQIDLTGVAAAAMRESDKTVDLAKINSAWEQEWSVQACIEHVATPTAGETVDFYWSPSPSVTAAVGNPGGVVGADGDYTAAGLDQMIFIGSLVLRANTINIGQVGVFRPTERYGTLVVVNSSPTKAMAGAGSMDETHIVMNPLNPQVQ